MLTAPSQCRLRLPPQRRQRRTRSPQFQVLPPMHIAQWVFGLAARAPATTARTTPTILRRFPATLQSWTTVFLDTNHRRAIANSPRQPSAGREKHPTPSAQTHQVPFVKTTAHAYPTRRAQLRVPVAPWQTMQAAPARARQSLAAATHRCIHNCQTEIQFLCQLPLAMLSQPQQLRPKATRADNPSA